MPYYVSASLRITNEKLLSNPYQVVTYEIRFDVEFQMEPKELNTIQYHCVCIQIIFHLKNKIYLFKL